MLRQRSCASSLDVGLCGRAPITILVAGPLCLAAHGGIHKVHEDLAPILQNESAILLNSASDLMSLLGIKQDLPRGPHGVSTRGNSYTREAPHEYPEV
jgi:hypothetical protein